MEQADLFQEIVHSPTFQQVIENTSRLLGDVVWWTLDRYGQKRPLHLSPLWCPVAKEDDQVRQKCQDELQTILKDIGTQGECVFQECCQGYVRALIPFIHQNRFIGCLGVCYIPQCDIERARYAVELLQRYASLFTDFLSQYDDLEFIHDIWRQMISTTGLEDLLPRILSETLHALGLSQGILYLVDDDGSLEPRCQFPATGDIVNRGALDIDFTPYHRAFQSSGGLMLNLASEDPLRLETIRMLRKGRSVYGLEQQQAHAIAICRKPFLLGIVVAMGEEGKQVALGSRERMLGVIMDGAAAVLDSALNLDRVEQRSLALSTIHTIHRLMGAVNSETELLERIAQLTTQVLRVTQCSILMLDEKKGLLNPVASTGLEEGEIGTFPLLASQGIPGWVWDNYEPIIANNPLEDPRFETPGEPSQVYRGKSYLSVPMIEEDLLGVITISGRERPFTPADREILLTLTEQAVIALGNIQLIEQHQELVISSLRSIANVVEMRNPESKGHTRRVEEIALALGRKVSTDRKWLLNLRYATLLHDSGKIGLLQQSAVQVPTLRKNVAEMHGDMEQIYREHPMISVQVARSMKMDREVIDMIRHHHENFDGSGFPVGLKGEEIPLGSRIIALADAYVTLEQKGVKHKTYTRNQILAILKKMSGRRLDPKLFDIFCDLEIE